MPFLLEVVILGVITLANAQQADPLGCPDGWFYLGGGQCYQLFHGVHSRTYERAADVCKSYGSRLVTIPDQDINDRLGSKVSEISGNLNEQYYIGLSQEKTSTCATCKTLRWSSGRNASDHEGYWADSQPDYSNGGCVYSMKNMEDYVYDRPYTWTASNCYMKRSFVCERPAAPSGCFHCSHGGFVSPNRICDGNNDCQDGSDEINCPNLCRFYHKGTTGSLGAFTYRNAQTCTWAIETPLGTNAYVQLRNFMSESVADYATVYIGSLDPTRATRIARLSGNQGTKEFRSYNNMMIIVFTTDAQITDTGFTGTWNSLTASSGHSVSLTATNTPQTYTVETFQFANMRAYLGQKDYIIVIAAQDKYQVGQMITVKIEAISLHDSDTLIAFDGDSANSKKIATICNECATYNVVYSTGNYISLLLRTGREISTPVNLRISYQQGCHFETQARFGSIFTPGYHGVDVDYPNFVTCTWKITVPEPLALKFSDDTQLVDTTFNRVNNGDILQIFDGVNRSPLHSGDGFTTAQVRDQTIVATTGTVEVVLTTSPTRSARGFMATWSPECLNPNYDANTIVAGSIANYYTGTMTLTCATGYLFHQEQIPVAQRQGPITITCGYRGLWENYLEIPRCTPVFCGAVPNIANGYIKSSVGSTFGNTADYECYDGSTLTGNSQITCQADGTWSPRPTCNAASCPSNQITTFISDGNGNLVAGDGTAIGSIYRYTCDSGYQMNGSPTVFCNNNGIWEPANEPTCIRLTCRLHPIMHGFYNGRGVGDFITYETTASVSCNTGYSLQNPAVNTVTCYANRTTEPLPVCVDNDECVNSPCVGGTCHNTDGSFYCTCGAGYVLSIDQVTCTDFNECQIGNDHGCDGTCQNSGGSYSCSCNAPYVLYRADGTSGLNIPSGESGNLPTDVYHVNHSCVLVQCLEPPPVQNAVLHTRRAVHLYGDWIEYQCNIGYAPLTSSHQCRSDGTWSGTLPTCTPVQCTDDRGAGLLNEPTYNPGPYNYLTRVNLSCSLANNAITFERFRFCTYDRLTNTYRLEGSPWECGVVDCGPPVGTSAVVVNTRFGSTFEWTCGSGSRTGQSTANSFIVTCQADGTWNYGSLQCVGDSCLDPGTPLGGTMSATSFADGSVVTFDCPAQGYELQGPASLTCIGQNWNGLVPTCVDVQKPVISGCPTSNIIIQKYEQLAPRLPSIQVSDNTGIKSIVLTPSNANTTLYVSGQITVKYVVSDFADNTEECSFEVNLYDEEPPFLTCPSLHRISLSNDNDEVTYELQSSLFPVSDNSDSPQLTVPQLGQTIFRPIDLYKTINFIATAVDPNNNRAQCRGQVFIEPVTCSPLSFPTPINSQKTCTAILGGLQCTITCDANYILPAGKSVTVTCTGGSWQQEWIPACVLDVTPPALTCPPPQVRQFTGSVTDITFDMLTIGSLATYSDLNTLNAPTFSQNSLTLTPSDLYQARQVQMSVSDIAGNTATCTFQVMVIAAPCHPLSYPTPLRATKTCTQRPLSQGYDCTITCDSGYIIRNVGQSRTVSCSTGVGWADSDRITACILDTTPPTLSCPPSDTIYLNDGDDLRTIDLSQTYLPIASDTGGVGTTIYNPQVITVSVSDLNTRRGPFQIQVSDLRGNTASCNFYITVLARTCSPLSLPSIPNANTACTASQNGYDCTLTCNSGYVIPTTGLTSMTTSCLSNGAFSPTPIGCTSVNSGVDQISRGSMYFKYTPSDGTTNLPNSCTSYYRGAVAESIYTAMSSQLTNVCRALLVTSDFTLNFIPDTTTSSIGTSNGNTNNLVTLTFFYTMSSTNASYYEDCNTNIAFIINSPTSSSLQFENPIPADPTQPTVCPELTFDANQVDPSGVNQWETYCLPPYYITATTCLMCPAGTESDGIVCSQCPVGSYRLTGSSAGCQTCPTGYTTRYIGATSSSACVAPCGNGQISVTGYAPCYNCPKGTYSTSTTVCQSCSSGQTTQNEGSASINSCFPDSTTTEPCPQGSEVSTVAGQCNLCPQGQYGIQSNSNGICISCVSGSTYIKGATALNQCYGVCGSGLISSNGLAPCTPCPRGSYFVNATFCQTCQTGFTTVGTGALSSASCVSETSLRLKCSRGKQRNVVTGLCEKCPIGTWNSQEDGTCQSCSSDSSTYFTGATSPTMCFQKCPPGFSSSTGLSPCNRCGLGMYSEAYGSTTCQNCPANTITVTDTSSSQAECLAQCGLGQYSYSGYNANSCRSCPVNHYQDQTGSTDCDQCLSNSQYSIQQGLTSSASCLDATSLCANRCQNGGVCSILNNEPVCSCATGYYGPTCANTANYCLSNPCYNNGICSQTVGGFTCNCQGLATGARCEVLTKVCDTSESSPTCKNDGHCINKPGSYECLCANGFSGVNCTETTPICVSKPCDIDGSVSCEDVSNGQKLRRKCICRPGYTGEDCELDINECDSNPCVNGGTCSHTTNQFFCACPSGYGGTFCETRLSQCFGVSCGSDPSPQCIDVYSHDQHYCSCSKGYRHDAYYEYSINRGMAPDGIATNQNGVVRTIGQCRDACQSDNNCGSFTYHVASSTCYTFNSFTAVTMVPNGGYDSYTKTVRYPEDDFWTMRYDLNTPTTPSFVDSERLNDLNNLGLNICHGTRPLYARCCQVGSNCLDNTAVPSNVCLQGTNPGVSSSNGIDYDVQFLCSESRVFLEDQCQLKTDYCTMHGNPCLNNGQCRNIAGGYQCLCAAGYAGKNCQTDEDNCVNNPCRNGGMCTDKVNSYECTCATGYTGTNCDSIVNYCLGQTCTNRGTCNNIVAVGYKCNCLPGYTGTDCETEINFCASNPCLHGATCNPLLNGYTCTCVPGWVGTNCETFEEKCSLGTGCLATCHNLFNGYYCQCPANTYGSNCEKQPNPCQDYNMCQYGSSCSYANDIMSCSCPTKYTGDGCHILRDLCGSDASTNPCENGGECTPTPTGYQCSCKPGYQGTNCQTEINECANVVCQGGGTCFDDVNNYYCRCPLTKTGTNCARDFDRNYDLYFNHPEGLAYAWIPYFISVSNTNALSVAMWVRYSNNDGTGMFLNLFTGDRLVDGTKFLEMNQEGVRIYGMNGMNVMFLQYDREAKLNDGNWHHIVLNMDLNTGQASLYLDTVFHDSETNSLLAINNAYRMWVVLGCDFDSAGRTCMGGTDSFHGYISQVNWYSRTLSFSGSPGDISYNFANPQHYFTAANSITPLVNNVLVWNEYELESGVTRVIPSEAHGEHCGVIGRSPPCSHFTSRSLPSVNNCPGDIYIYSEGRVSTVTWTEPTFSNLGNLGQVQFPVNRPGSLYAWGTYDVIYVGSDGDNNKAFCHFRIYVQSSQCSNPVNPFSGTQSCTVQSPPTIPDTRKGCMLSCFNPTQYVIDRPHPDLFTCGPSGSWNLANQFRKFRYPACGLLKPLPRSDVHIRVSYFVESSACEAVKTNIRVRLHEEFRNMNTIFKQQGSNLVFCKVSDCSDVTIDQICSVTQAGSTSASLLVLMNMTGASAMTTLDNEQRSILEFLRYFILGDDILNFSDTVPNAFIDKFNVYIDATPVCPEGEALVDGQCVECGAGNYYVVRNGVGICHDCPLGQYQTNAGQTSCTACPTGQTTEMTGTYEATGCKESCPVGSYFNNTANGCSLCPVGYYQDQVGQFYCKFCGAGFTTENEGTTSASKCSASCDSGRELNSLGQCVPCQIGTYRNASETRKCVNCPTGYITLTTATNSRSLCNIIACEPGTFRNGSVCQDCPLNQYQNEKWQTSCKSCGDPSRYLTLSTRSETIDDCKFYCPSGYEVAANEMCTICPRTEYKDNTVNPLMTCQSCPVNKIAPTSGAKADTECTIYRCSAGYYPNAQNTGCLECPLGSYQDAPDSISCITCSSGFSTRNTASNTSTACETYCPSGQEKTSSGCSLCPRGEYKNNNDGLFSMCVSCPPEYTTAGLESTHSDNCTIRTCLPGYKRNADDSGCEACPLGTYQPLEYQLTCNTCGPGTSTENVASDEATDCKPYCPSGQEMINNVCTSCKQGYYKNNTANGLFSMCQMCDIEKITSDVGSTSINDCNIGNCSAGSFLRDSDKLCQLCPKGQYQDNKWQTSCISCGQDKTTENTGSDSLSDCILECEPGDEDINGVCQPCKRGFFKAEYAAASCKACPAGTTTDITGATSNASCVIPACVPGQYLDRTNTSALVCRVCEYDTYQHLYWQDSCIACLNNKVTLVRGATTADQCVPNCQSGEQYNANAQQCELCERGYYRDSLNRLQPACVLCPIDTITSGIGSTGITDCNIANCTTPGYYRDVNTNTCKMCDFGSYQNQKWMISCNSCPVGESTRIQGATSQADCRKVCPLGQYVDNSNICQLCPRGFYRSDMASDTCTQCSQGLLTPSTGAKSENDCTVSPCQAGEYYITQAQRCEKCEIGSYQPEAGKFQCTACEYDIKFTPSTGSTSQSDCLSQCSAGEKFNTVSKQCEPCDPGTYQPSAGLFSCLACPTNQRYTAGAGATSVTQCKSLCSADANPTCSPNATCTLTDDGASYTCSCFQNYVDVSTVSSSGRTCLHTCDNNYCKNGAVCIREPAISCQCSVWYEGSRCQTRVEAKSLSDDTTDIVIPVSIAAGGLLLLIVLIVVFCLCWRSASRSRPKPAPQYSEFQGDKVSVYSYGYGQAPYNAPPSRLMLAPYPEMVYDNQAYKTEQQLDDDLESAIYQA